MKPFLRECECLAKCASSEHILKLLGYGKVENTHFAYAVTEYCGKYTLRQLLQRTSFEQVPWNEKERIMVWIQFCNNQLELLHGLRDIELAKLCHHDLKLDNIMLSDKGAHAIILDFGMATCEDGDMRKQGKGTIQYAAPEAFHDKMCHASDTWSMGVVFYELCTHGELPFMNLDESKLKADIAKKQVRHCGICNIHM